MSEDAPSSDEYRRTEPAPTGFGFRRTPTIRFEIGVPPSFIGKEVEG